MQQTYVPFYCIPSKTIQRGREKRSEHIYFAACHKNKLPVFIGWTGDSGCPTSLDSEGKAHGEIGLVKLGKDTSCSYFKLLKPLHSFDSFGFSKIERLGSKCGVSSMKSGCWFNSYSHRSH
jgi:hypothetical protein